MPEKHTQVPFRRIDGQIVTVDEGLERVMVMLRDRGVATAFSCQSQGDLEQGYIIMPMLSGWRFRRMIRGTSFAKNLDISERSVEFGLFRKKGTLKVTVSSAKVTTAFRTEHMVSKRYGLRTCIRWPADWTDMLESALTRANPVPQGD